MQTNVTIDIKNRPTPIKRGYVVLTLDEGRLWFYGSYDDEARANKAVNEKPDCRFMVKIG